MTATVRGARRQTSSIADQRARDGRELARMNAANRERNAPPPLPRRTPSQDGVTVGGLVDDKFNRR